MRVRASFADPDSLTYVFDGGAAELVVQGIRSHDPDVKPEIVIEPYSERRDESGRVKVSPSHVE